MKRSSFKPRTKPMARTAFNRVGILSVASVQLKQRAAEGKTPKRMRSKQRPVSPAERKLWDRLAGEIGCIACRIDGNENPFVSIHHVDGRTKPGCHDKVLPLCAGHHQDGTGNDKTMVAVHPNRARFEALYGTQYELLATVMEILGMPK